MIVLLLAGAGIWLAAGTSPAAIPGGEAGLPALQGSSFDSTPAKLPPVAAPIPASPDGSGKPIEIDFARLASYRYAIPPDLGRAGKGAVLNQIPADIRSLHGKKVTIEAFMIPMDFEKGKVLTFVLSDSVLSCCFAELRINELIRVSMADGKPVDPCSVARVTGTFGVVEEVDDGILTGLYRLLADQVTIVPIK